MGRLLRETAGNRHKLINSRKDSRNHGLLGFVLGKKIQCCNTSVFRNEKKGSDKYIMRELLVVDIGGQNIKQGAFFGRPLNSAVGEKSLTFVVHV